MAVQSLLFIHGVTSDWSSWERIVPGFVDSWHCYAVDLRGHGKSGHIPGGYHRALTLLPNARGETWADSRHGMHTMFPDWFVETMQAFFAGVPVG